MASQKDIELTYDYMDELFRKRIGQNADISCAWYENDFNLTLEQAQLAKHEFILDNIGCKEGDRILDIGCGWGPLLKVIRDHGAEGIGLTLSPAQAQACKESGFTVYIKDFKEALINEFGKFDGIAGVGCFEHLCSVKEKKEGKQDAVYDHFFKSCRELLKPGGRLYMQTMAWGKRVPEPEEMDVTAPKLSDSWVLGHLSKYYPGSWLSNGKEHIEKCAAPYFTLVYAGDGRLDYVQTLKEWGNKVAGFSLEKLKYTIKILPRYLTDQDFRYQITSFRYSCNRLCFERDIMRLPRLVFKAK